MYAPKLPFKYLHENKERAYQDSDTNERYRRQLLKESKQLLQSPVSPNKSML